MKSIEFENKRYTEFNKSKEAENWAKKHYQKIINTKNITNIKTVLFYTGSNARKWNQVMRRSPSIEDEKFIERAKEEFAADGEQLSYIKCLYQITKTNEIPENIILYRYTKKEHIKSLCKNKKIKENKIYQDKAFTSTTLVKNNLIQFAKEHEYDCLLRIYTPKGAKGIYSTIKKKIQKLDEQEVILKPLTKFEIIKIHKNTKPLLIEVKAIQD